MIDLSPRAPCQGLLPRSFGALELRAPAPFTITSLMPQRGKEAALDRALQKVHDVALPATGRVSRKAGLRVIWTGRGQYFLCTTHPPSRTLARIASLTEQSDAWAVLHLTGAGAEDVMARLCPVDLRAQTFKRTHAARSELAHMMVVITRTSGGFELMVMRSLARTAIEKITDAMASVTAERAIL